MTKEKLEELLVSYGVTFTDALADALIDFFGCEIWNCYGGPQIIAPKGAFKVIYEAGREDEEDDI